MPKAAIKREQSHARMSYAEREQARRSQSRQRKAIAKFNGATVATEDMLTADRIKWVLALNKQAMKVDYSLAQETADPEPETPSGGGDNNGGGNNGGGDLEG